MRFFDYDRATRLMEDRGIDLVLVQTPANVVYLSDHLCPWASNTLMLEDGRAFYVTFVGVARDPQIPSFMVTTLSEEGHISHGDTWIKEVRYWGTSFIVEGQERQMDFVDDPIQAVGEALEARGLEMACIGLEMEHIPVAAFDRLRMRLPKATFADAWPVLWDLRAIKHPEEIRRMHLAAQASEKAIQAGFESAREGMTELEMERVVAQVVAEEGCRYEWSSVAFGTKGAIMVGATKNRLKQGDIVRLDLVASYRGWLSDMSRNAVFGTPSQQMQDAHAAVCETNAFVRSAVHPGVTGDDLYRLGFNHMRERGYRLLTQQVGHGVGRNSNERPFLAPGVMELLQPNMVITVEPALRLVEVGSINVEDMLVVTQEGSESLTTMTGVLQQIG